MSRTIPADDAQEIVWGDHIAIQDVSSHRWYTRQLVVFMGSEGPMGFYYDDPATEMQEDQERFDSDPVPIFPVRAREVTTTVYEAS